MCPVRRRRWHPTPVLLPGKSHGQRSLVGYGPWGREESDTTERLPFHFSLSCIGAGNGNPLQCSCLEIPRDGGAWWAAACGVTQSWTWLKRLSSSSSNIDILGISELRWTGMGEFNSDDHDIYYGGQESLKRNGVAITVNKRVQNAVLECSLKNDIIICLFPRQTIQYHSNQSLCPD